MLTFLLLFTSGITCFSQSFALADDFKTLVNGAEIFQSGPSDTLQLITWLHITNKTGNTRQVKMKKQELAMLPGGSSSICWAGYCYGPEMTVSTFPLTMVAGETVSGCFGHFGPNGCRGISVVRWVFFNESDPSDSLSITVHYSTFPSAVETSQVSQFSLSVAGSVPADDRIDFRYSVPTGLQGMIEFRNLSGKLVSGKIPVFLTGKFTLNTSQLPAGIYLCILLVEGKSRETRKILVYH